MLATAADPWDYMQTGFYYRYYLYFPTSYWFAPECAGYANYQNQKLFKFAGVGDLEGGLIYDAGTGAVTSVYMQFSKEDGNTDSGRWYPIPSGHYMFKNQWNKIEMYIKIPPTGSYNSTIHLAINGGDTILLTNETVYKGSYSSARQMQSVRVTGGPPYAPMPPSGHGTWYLDDLKIVYGEGDLVGSDGTGDTTPPVISNGSPTGTLPAGTTQTTMSVITNESATCRYSTTAGTPYSSMTGMFLTPPGTSHSTSITGLTNGQTYNRYIRCQDTAGNANTNDYPINFSVANSVCGNLLCESGESCSSCPGDCGSCATVNECDNWQTKHPEWLFCDDFESSTVNNYDGGWKEYISYVSKSQNPQNVFAGNKSIQATITPGVNSAASLYKYFTGQDGDVYARWYAKFDSNYNDQGYQHFVTLQGLDTSKPCGCAGCCANTRPNGDDRFLSGLEFIDSGGTSLRSYLYSYFYNQRNPSTSYRCCPKPLSTWAKIYEPAVPVTINKGSWHVMELMMHPNTPGKDDGYQTYWIDGVLAMNITAARELCGPYTSSPYSTECETDDPTVDVYPNFYTNPPPYPTVYPAEGFIWRTTSNLKINNIWLQVYNHQAATNPGVNKVWFDNLVVSKNYISEYNPSAQCGNSQCESGETCSSCPQDCLSQGQVCCSGTTYAGNCCSSSECSSPQTCINHQCQVSYDTTPPVAPTGVTVQ
jgi:hypothetical protein